MLKTKYPTLLHQPKYHDAHDISSSLLENLLNPLYSHHILHKWLYEYPPLMAYAPISNNFRLRVLIVCGQHAREFITAELCYHFIRLLQLQERDPDLTIRLQELRILGVGFWIVPVANPVGRHMISVNSSRACMRKNPDGVDLNRNWPISSSCKKRPIKDPDSSEYGGPYPGSEIETQVLMKYINSVKPNLVLNVHSGIESVLLPYDCSAERLAEKYATMVRLANLAKIDICPSCKVGQASLILYPSAGTLMDYVISIGTKLAYTLEIYEAPDADNSIPDKQLTPEQCIKWFNPPAGKPYKQVISKWLRFIITLVEKTQERKSNLDI